MCPTPALCWLRPNCKPTWMFTIQPVFEHEDLWKCRGHVLPCQNQLLLIVVVLDNRDRCDNQLWSSWWPLKMMTPWCGNKCWSGEPVCGCCRHQPKQQYWNTESLESVEKSEEPHRAAETHCRETRWHWQPQMQPGPPDASKLCLRHGLVQISDLCVAIDLLREPLCRNLCGNDGLHVRQSKGIED